MERADGDLAFSRSIADRPVVLGVFLTPTHNGSQASLTPKAGFSFVGDQPTSLLTNLSGVLVPIPILANAATGLGFLNWLPDNDRVVRRVPLLLNIHDQIQPSLVLETLRVAQGASNYLIKSTGDYGSTAGKSTVLDSLKVGDIVVPLQSDGELRVWFGKSDPRRSIPAWKVLQPDADLSDLAGKIVFVGASAALLSDIVATPLNPSTPGVEAHAQLVEQILTGVTLERPDWAAGAEAFLWCSVCDCARRDGSVAAYLLDGAGRARIDRSPELPELERLHAAWGALQPRGAGADRRLRLPIRRRPALQREAATG